VDNFNKVKLQFIIHEFLNRFLLFFPFWIIYLLDVGLTLPQVAMMDIAFWLSIFIFEIPTGVIADKISRKFSVILSFFIQSISIFLFAFVTDIVFFLIIYIFWGIAVTLNSGAFEAWFFDEIKYIHVNKTDEELQKIFQGVDGVVQSVGLLSSALAYSISGYFAEISLKLPIILTSIVYIFAVIWLLFIRETPLPQSSLNSNKGNVKQSIKTIISPQLIPFVLVTIVLSSFIMSLIFWMQTYLDSLGILYTNIGFILSGAVLISSVGSSLSSTFSKYFKRYTLFTCNLLIGVSMISMGLSSYLPLNIALYFMIRLINASIKPYLSSMLNMKIESDVRATTLSIIGSFSTLFILTVELFSAIYIDARGYPGYFILSGIFFLIFCIPLSIIVIKQISLLAN